MDIEIQMIGTGSAFAKKYYNNNALVTCNGFTLLVDCGITAPRAIHELNLTFSELGGIFISHLHGDHVGGLEEAALQMMHVYKQKPRLYIPSKLKHPLWEHTLRGGLENQSEGLTGLDSYFHVVELKEGEITEIHSGFELETRATRHIAGKPSYGIFINQGLFFSADSRFDLDMIEEVHNRRNCRYIFHDCQLLGPGAVHASLDELLTLPEEIQEKIWLMHYGDDMESFIGKTGAMTFVEQHKTYHFPL